MFDNLLSESKYKFLFLSSIFLVTASSAFLYAKNKLNFLNNNNNDDKNTNNRDNYYTNRSNYVKHLKQITNNDIQRLFFYLMIVFIQNLFFKQFFCN